MIFYWDIDISLFNEPKYNRKSNYDCKGYQFCKKAP